MFKPNGPKINASTNEHNHGNTSMSLSKQAFNNESKIRIENYMRASQKQINVFLIYQVPNIDNPIKDHMLFLYDITKTNSKKIHVIESKVNQLNNRIEMILYAVEEYRNTFKGY